MEIRKLLSLLKRLKSIERGAGRKRDSILFGPQILDLDIILYDDLVLDDPRLTIPHPRVHTPDAQKSLCVKAYL